VAKSFEVFSKGKIYGEIILILLTIGSWHRGFDRLVKAVDDLKKTGLISDEVLAQIGDGNYIPTYLNSIDYYSPDEFVNLIHQSRVVIGHAGMGTIIEATKQKKPVIVVPRIAKLGEANTDHQFNTAKQLEAEGKILVAYDVSELPLKLKEATAFVPTVSESCQEILQAVQKFIEDVGRKKRKLVNNK